MNFCPRELSEKLQRLGCVSISKFWSGSEDDIFFSDVEDPWDGDIKLFILEDFLGSHPEAIENCKKIWIKKEITECPVCDTEGVWKLDEWVFRRHVMLDVSDQWAYLERTMVDG